MASQTDLRLIVIPFILSDSNPKNFSRFALAGFSLSSKALPLQVTCRTGDSSNSLLEKSTGGALTGGSRTLYTHVKEILASLARASQFALISFNS